MNDVKVHRYSQLRAIPQRSSSIVRPNAGLLRHWLIVSIVALTYSSASSTAAFADTPLSVPTTAA